MEASAKRNLIVTWGAVIGVVIVSATSLILARPAAATAEFAKQTGKACGDCHTSGQRNRGQARIDPPRAGCAAAHHQRALVYRAVRLDVRNFVHDQNRRCPCTHGHADEQRRQRIDTPGLQPRCAQHRQCAKAHRYRRLTDAARGQLYAPGSE
jgi:hypothetical protein